MAKGSGVSASTMPSPPSRATHELSAPNGSPSWLRALRVLRSFSFEIGLIFGLLAFYEQSRQFASGRIGQAETNAHWLWRLERDLHLVNEVHVQDLLLKSTTLVHLANRYYVTVHFPLTAVFLVWLFWRHRPSYSKVRNTLVLLTAFGLLFTIFVPLAPPRLFTGDGLIDTMQVFGPSTYNPDSTTGVANQYAAMPSLHVAWAVLIAITVVRLSNRRIRWLAVLHPVITLFVVVATGNHYWLDGFVGFALLGLAAMIVYRWRWFLVVGGWLYGLLGRPLAGVVLAGNALAGNALAPVPADGGAIDLTRDRTIDLTRESGDAPAVRAGADRLP
jgi:hypothetical protein